MRTVGQNLGLRKLSKLTDPRRRELPLLDSVLAGTEPAPFFGFWRF